MIYYIIHYFYSKIYCKGDILHAVQTSKVFSTSKTFVDLRMTNNESTIIENFNALYKTYNGDIPYIELERFVFSNFQFHGLKTWLPPDFKNHPKIIDYVQDYNYK